MSLCLAVLSYGGIQGDEALFAGPLYSDWPHDLKFRTFHHDVPLMLMSYLGTAKTWLFGLIFQFLRPGIVSLRLPMVVIGALTLWALFRLASQTLGGRVAAAVCLLVATDASFVLTTTFDWGPVAIQHLAYVCGLLFVFNGFQRKSAVLLGLGFLLFGLGMWDKAIFIWMLSGTAVAALILFPAALRATITPRNFFAAALGFSIGAAPLILYNIRNPLKTFQGNAVFSTAEFDQKARLIRSALSGSALFGYLVNEEGKEAPKAPRNNLERACIELGEQVGEHRSGLLFYALLASLAAVPLWWRRRKAVFFALIVMLVAWLQMAFTKDAGTGLHHVVLLWPLPHLITAVALAEGTRRLRRASLMVFGTILAVLCISNLLVVNEYLYQFIRNGAGSYWTDAILPLSNEVSRWEDRPLLVTDWGMEPTLTVLHQGRLPRLWNVSDRLSHDLTGADRASVVQMFGLHGVFLTHTQKYEIDPGSIRRVVQLGEAFGYRRHLLQTINDSNGRAVFEIAEFVK